MSENTDVKLTFEACPLSTPEVCRRMKERTYGLDLHKKFILAAITDQGGTTVEYRFSRTQTDLFALRDRVLFHGCEVVACESISGYWIQVSDLFAEKIPVIVGNAQNIKRSPTKRPTAPMQPRSPSWHYTTLFLPPGFPTRKSVACAR